MISVDVKFSLHNLVLVAVLQDSFFIRIPQTVIPAQLHNVVRDHPIVWNHYTGLSRTWLCAVRSAQTDPGQRKRREHSSVIFKYTTHIYYVSGLPTRNGGSLGPIDVRT